MINRRVPLALSLAVGLLLSLVFVSGFAAGSVFQQSRSSSTDTSDASLRDFLSAYRLVTQHSYYRPDKQHLIQAAIDAMLAATGDPHTLFLSPNENRVADTQLNGARFSGIGAIVVRARNDLQVVAVIPKAPASNAGIKAGDVVTKIEGVPVSHISGDPIVRIHGMAGTTVNLTVTRGSGAPFTVKREQIPPITAYPRLLPHHLAEIQIISFGDTTSKEVSQALAFAKAQRVRGIILDLRDNPGGFVDAAQQIASDFLSHGVVAYERGLDKRLHSLPVIPGRLVTRTPVAILVNGGTASAAEITAAALRDNGRAKLIGTRTYGKGSMQSVYGLADGSSIRITDRLWLTPHRDSIQSVGLRPDITVNELASPGGTSEDSQLSAAEQYLLHPGK
jgi:carboxyl-terminal processing protease